MTLSQADRHCLDERGYLVLAGFMSGEQLAELRRRGGEVYDLEGDNAGAEFKPEPGCRRLANLADKGEVFRHLIVLPDVLACVRHVLGEAIKLSSLNARKVPPHGAGAQPLHADMAALPDEKGY